MLPADSRWQNRVDSVRNCVPQMAKAPCKEELTISGPSGMLEALLELPEGFAGDRVAVLCHPHPQFQGTMTNKVVHTLARAMLDMGIAALRFNFRGVGRSEGTYSNGDGEVDDVIAVADYASRRWPRAALWLAGFSFGAMVSVRAASRLLPQQLISVAPAVSLLRNSLQREPVMPWLIIQGAADDTVSPDAVRNWVAGLAVSPKLIELPGTGHFFHGKLIELRQTLLSELQGGAKRCTVIKGT